MRLLLMTGIFFAAFGWAQNDAPTDPIKTLAGRLDLERYKASIKGLTKFGDRREGTDRNRAAIDWIESQLKSYGCTNTERIHYEYRPPSSPPVPPFPGPMGGGVIKGKRGAVTGTPNTDPDKQPDAQLRQLNMQPSTPGPREEVFCTKIGTTHPEEMYLVGAHMDGKGWGDAANDDASGAALVMEIARILSAPEVTTERSIRFVLWNSEETIENAGSQAYINQRKDLQGKEDPPGSGKYPEPRWLGMIQHDMMLFDHGMPRGDGTVSEHQRSEADVNIEFQSRSKFAAQAAELAWAFRDANEKYATDYPAQVGNHMRGTDSHNFQDLIAAISLRELEAGSELYAGWDPTHHQPTDVFSHFSDDDFRLGLNAAQTTLGAVAQLAGARLREADPFVGNWRARNGGELRFLVENGQLRMEGKMILRDGNLRTVVVIYQFDGQEHPSEVSGETKHRKHTVVQKRIDDHTIESRTNHDDGKEYSTERYIISPDGSELTMTQRGQRSDGTPSENVVIFVRQ